MALHTSKDTQTSSCLMRVHLIINSFSSIFPFLTHLLNKPSPPFLIRPKRLNLPHFSAAFATSPLLMKVLFIAIFLMSYLHAVVHLAPTLWTQLFISNADGIN